jgi:hypothetical protein
VKRILTRLKALENNLEAKMSEIVGLIREVCNYGRYKKRF